MAGASGLGLWLGACSVLLHADDKQCKTDADCVQLGIVNGVCRLDVCQLGAPVSSTTDAVIASQAGAQSLPAPPSPTGVIGVAGVAGVAGAAGVAAASSAAAGVVAAAGSAAPTDPGCRPGACPECSTAADCPGGGLCVEGLCFASMPECSVDADCKTRGTEFDGGRCVTGECRPNPRWRCEKPAEPASAELRPLQLLVRDSLSLDPIPKLAVVACPKLDLKCTMPIASATTDDAGQLKIELPGNFAGYLQQTESSKYAPAMYFLPPVFPADGVLQPFPLLTAGAIIDALAFALGTAQDPSRGNLMLISEDCLGMALPGVTFSSPQSDAKTVQFYVRDTLPSTAAKDTAEIGNGGYLNFPVGPAVINLDMQASKLHLATASVVVRAGFISVAYIRPQTR